MKQNHYFKRTLSALFLLLASTLLSACFPPLYAVPF